MKNNVGPDQLGLAFRIEGVSIASPSGPIETSRVMWDEDTVTITADEAMRSPSGGDVALREASEWLQERLNEPTPAAEVFRAAQAVGISEMTLRRAAELVGVVKRKEGMRGGWTWSLPPKIITPKDDQHLRR